MKADVLLAKHIKKTCESNSSKEHNKNRYYLPASGNQIIMSGNSSEAANTHFMSTSERNIFF